MGSVNSLNSIFLGMDPTSLNVHSMVQGSSMAPMQKSTSSFTSNGRLMTLAEKLKMAHEQQRREKQDTIIQNYIKNH